MKNESVYVIIICFALSITISILFHFGGCGQEKARTEAYRIAQHRNDMAKLQATGTALARRP
jgi:hypothetical protein